MSLQTRLSDFITAVGTDYKQLRVWITGSSSGNLTGLTTTAKADLISAINEVNAKPSGSSSPVATEAVSGTSEIATQLEVDAGTLDAGHVTPLKLQTRLVAYAQVKSANLTALDVSSTAYGRGFLSLVDQAGLMGLLRAATEALTGVLRLATQAEMTTGTADNLIVTPLKHKVDGDARWQAKSTNLTTLAGFTTSTSATLVENSNTVLATQAATKAYADSLLDANNAYQYKGVIDASLNPNYPAASAGHTYRISVAGRIGGASGPVVEIGDTVTALVDGVATGTHATVGANWSIMQTNIDGAVVGPAASTSGNLSTFSGTTGKVIADSGVSVSTDGTMATNNNTKVPTEGAVRTYLGVTYYTKTEIGNPETDLVALYTTAKA